MNKAPYQNEVLDRFIEGVFRLMLEHQRAHVAELDLTVVQLHTLSSLAAAPCPATRLAASLGISCPAMTQLADRLIRKHLIERRPRDEDRRTVMISLTEQGTGIVDRFRKRRSEVFAEVLSRLSPAGQAEVVDSLNKLVIALEGSDMRTIAPPALSRVKRPQARTKPQPAEASKKEEVGQTPVNPPAKRMRIEWD
jgi:DNA-binding MarR family transcriptional regulator